MGVLEDAKAAMSEGVDWEVRAKENEAREQAREAEEKAARTVTDNRPKNVQVLEAVEEYTAAGIITHLCKPAEIGVVGTGKSPMPVAWQAQKSTRHINYMKAELKKNPEANLGILCGRASDVTVLDIDWYCKPIEDFLFKGLDTSKWVTQQHGNGKNGKKHIFFRHAKGLLPGQHQELGFDLLTNNIVGAGSNCICAPSVHYSGEVYRFNRPVAERCEMPKELIDRVNHLLEVYEGFKDVLSQCKTCFRGFWDAIFREKHSIYYHVTDLFRHEEGRRRHIALFADLKANGATNEQLLLACWMIFGNEFDEAKYKKNNGGISSTTPWGLEKILKDPVLAEFHKEYTFDPDKVNLAELEEMLKPNARDLYETLLCGASPEAFETVRKVFLLGAFSNGACRGYRKPEAASSTENVERLGHTQDMVIEQYDSIVTSVEGMAEFLNSEEEVTNKVEQNSKNDSEAVFKAQRLKANRDSFKATEHTELKGAMLDFKNALI